MIMSQSYLMAWGIYLLSALGLVIVFWRMTRSIPYRDFVKVLRLVVIVLLLYYDDCYPYFQPFPKLLHYFEQLLVRL
mgnify:CR=1 FL=1